jgi:hypothetical protein
MCRGARAFSRAFLVAHRLEDWKLLSEFTSARQVMMPLLSWQAAAHGLDRLPDSLEVGAQVQKRGHD